MKYMNNEGFRTLTREETLDLGRKSQGNEVWSKKGVFGRWKDANYRERSRRNKRNVVRTLYVEVLVSRQIERCRELSRIKTHELVVEELSRICWEVSTAKGSRWIEKPSSIYRASRKFHDGSSSYWAAIENAIKRSWKGSIDSLAVERCPPVVEIA